MMQRDPEPASFKNQGLPSEKIAAMKKKAMEMGARPVKLVAINAQACSQYYVGYYSTK